MKTRRRNKSVAGKGAVAKGLVVVMEIVDDVVEELWREHHGVVDRSLGWRPARSAA